MDFNTAQECIEALESVCTTEADRGTVRYLAWLNGWMWMCKCDTFNPELDPFCSNCGGERSETEG